MIVSHMSVNGVFFPCFFSFTQQDAKLLLKENHDILVLTFFLVKSVLLEC
jgi:hypothetical protein